MQTISVILVIKKPMLDLICQCILEPQSVKYPTSLILRKQYLLSSERTRFVNDLQDILFACLACYRVLFHTIPN